MMAEQEAKPIFGISVLETLTTGMYTNPLDALRELVQNSVDSIRDTLRQGLITEAEARIDIVIDPEARRITVRDNGTGIPSTEARARLTNVGQSQKSLEENIGFRGIGRLHGIAYCEKLSFRTSAYGEAVATEVQFDAKGLRLLMSPSMRREERAEDILYASTDVTTGKESPEAHFFEATLNNVTPEVPSLLDFAEIQSYLSQVAPVDFDTGFIWGPKIKKWARDHGLDLPSIPVVIMCGGSKERYVYKPYRSSYKPLRDTREETKKAERIEIDDIDFFPKDDPIGRGFWIWYSKGNLLGQIGDRSAAGLRLRKHNMSIGAAARIEELLKDARFNRYFIGEVHVISPECIPNARRDGFEDTEAWAAIKNSLCEFMQEREKEVRNASKLRSGDVSRPIRMAMANAKKAKSEAGKGVTSKIEREKLLNELAVSKAKLEAIPSTKITEELRQSYDQAVAELEGATTAVENAEFVLAQTKGQLDRKQKKLLQEILETLAECLSSDTFKVARDAIMARFEPKDGK
jgi:molecular chaperone HtpG